MKKKQVKLSLQLKRLSSMHVLYVSLGIVFIILFFNVISGLQPPCANSISCIDNLLGDYEVSAKSGEFLGTTVAVPPEQKTVLPNPNILGETTSQKRIAIDLTNQRLYAHEGNTVVYNFPISSGKFGTTPNGDFKIWYKVKYTRMAGGDKAKGTYYNLPNVPYTMFFYNDKIPQSRGYGVHGAYWHNNFGQPMSHGCINLRPEDAEKLYFWAEPYPSANAMSIQKDAVSTPITIYGKYGG